MKDKKNFIRASILLLNGMASYEEYSLPSKKTTLLLVFSFIIIDIDECIKHDVCGHGATCANTEGSYTCACPEETIPDPDPYIKCVGIVRCEVDDDCPGNSICDPQKRCLCPEPNVGNDCRRMYNIASYVESVETFYPVGTVAKTCQKTTVTKFKFDLLY